MQTFLPYADFERCAAVLDRSRLGKQRVEALQILRAVRFPHYGWQSHPAVRMWRGHEGALVGYGLACAAEWVRRGHPDRCSAQIEEFGDALASRPAAGLPPWLGDEALHRSHRSALLRKDPTYYRPLFADVPDDLPYVWPQPAPAVPPAPGPRTGWGVRGDLRSCGVVVRVANARRWHPAVHAFLEEAAAGESLAVAAGDAVVLGVLEGQARYDGNTLVVPARWSERRPRRSLRDRAAMQDPRPVFPLAQLG